MVNKKKLGITEWEIIVQEQQSSGQTITAYCQERALSRHQFGYWRKRLHQLKTAQRPVPEFIELLPATEKQRGQDRSGSVTISLGACTLHYDHHTDSGLFKAAVQLLLEVTR